MRKLIEYTIGGTIFILVMLAHDHFRTSKRLQERTEKMLEYHHEIHRLLLKNRQYEIMIQNSGMDYDYMRKVLDAEIKVKCTVQ